jgi:hypothetical protein
VNYLDAFDLPAFTDAKELTDGSVLLDGFVDCQGLIIATLERERVANYSSDPDIELVDDDAISPLDSEVRVMFTRRLRVYFEASYDPESGILRDLETKAVVASDKPASSPSPKGAPLLICPLG